MTASAPASMTPADTAHRAATDTTKKAEDNQ